MPKGNRCIICGAVPGEPHWKGLLRCPKCGFVWFDSSRSQDQIARLYEKNYFFGEEYVDYLKEKPWLQKGFAQKLKRLRRFQKEGRLLEVGCAFGFFLELAQKHFEAEGIDVSPDAVRHAREVLGLNVREGELLSMDMPENHFDAIVSWATLEHLDNPELYVKKISRLLKPGGVFAFTTGDIEAPLARLQKGGWRLIYPPTHLCYFSTASLKKLMGSNGLSPIHDEWLGEYRSIDNMFYMLLALRGYKKIYDSLNRFGLTRGGFYLNTFDIVYMAARKET